MRSCAEVAAEQGRTVRADPEPEKGLYYRSDHFSFAKVGVPAFDPDAGIDFVGKPAGWGLKKREEYTANDYHKPSDVIKPDWDLSGAIQDCQLFSWWAIAWRMRRKCRSGSRTPNLRPSAKLR